MKPRIKELDFSFTFSQILESEVVASAIWRELNRSFTAFLKSNCSVTSKVERLIFNIETVLMMKICMSGGRLLSFITASDTSLNSSLRLAAPFSSSVILISIQLSRTSRRRNTSSFAIFRLLRRCVSNDDWLLLGVIKALKTRFQRPGMDRLYPSNRILPILESTSICSHTAFMADVAGPISYLVPLVSGSTCKNSRRYCASLLLIGAEYQNPYRSKCFSIRSQSFTNRSLGVTA